MPMWSDFYWVQDGESCSTGSKAIGNEWLGTVMGNYTESGVEKTDSPWKGPIPANPAVYQIQASTGDDILCGTYFNSGVTWESYSRSIKNLGSSGTAGCPAGYSPCIDDVENAGTMVYC